MTLQWMPKEAVPAWITQIRSHYRLYGPVSRAERTVFDEIENAEELDLNYTTTILPPKKVLLPPRELLFRFAGNGNAFNADVPEPPAPTVVFGVHTCDLHAFALLDSVYGAEPADQHYRTRRESSVLVSIECLRPCSEDALCKDMGTLVTPDIFDLHLTDLGDAYAVAVGSEKGALLLPYAPELRPADAATYRRLDQVLGEKWPRFPYRLQADVSELPGLLQVNDRNPLWQVLGDQCFGCGACTLVCPTCTCFDVCDDVDFGLRAGTRERVWDSCQFRQFATVAGGHDFRQGRAARLRHRFNRKYRYDVGPAGPVGCVGCGRCAQVCLAAIKPAAVLNKLQQQRAAARSSAVRQEVRS
jgi:ferredoxin